MTVEVSRGGKVLYHGDHRYRPEIELQMLESGYKVDGKKITLSEARKRASEAGRKR